MDIKRSMIVVNGRPVSSDVIDHHYDESTKKWSITFKYNGTIVYDADSVVLLKDPIRVDHRHYQIRYKNEQLNNITAIYSFKDNETIFWHVCFSNGYECEYIYDELEVNGSVLRYDDARDVFDYLSEVAECTGYSPENGSNILSSQYQKVSYLRDKSVAGLYLHPDNISNAADISIQAPIFPFGCNESQFIAVSNALKSGISVIEGPPGTGKTQTILNIIANLVLLGKTVHVVSNNNSAVDNLEEKLASVKYQFGFIAARLGHRQKKDEFISSQNGIYPDISTWISDEYESSQYRESVSALSEKLHDVFETKKRLADLRKEKYDIEQERDHLCAYAEKMSSQITDKKLSSSKYMEFWHQYQDIIDGVKKAGLIYRLICRFSFGISIKKLLQEDADIVINKLQRAYYDARLEEIDGEISHIVEKMKLIDADRMIAELTHMSLRYFRAHLAHRYQIKNPRYVFKIEELRSNPKRFLEEYPVVLSTTYTAISSLGENARFDYVIIDEASQTDIATGMLALSCASHAVIVGDTKQLPPVIASDKRLRLKELSNKYRIGNGYRQECHSILSSIAAVMGDKIPCAILLEHYRCHPQIIGFCNQQFYNGDLIVMSDDSQKEMPLRLVTTVAGQHKRLRVNQRQIDVICTEILPKIGYPYEKIGIIAPYRDHVEQLNNVLAEKGVYGVDIGTVHSFQGREKDIIILSTVDDNADPFSDDPNLLNVAISRAKKQLIVVASDNARPAGSNIGALIWYIRYNNCDVQHSQIRSVFDHLYVQYTQSRYEYLKKHKRISEHDSENLMYALIQEVIKKYDKVPLGVICHQPLHSLFSDLSKLNDDERSFIKTGLSHLDFLIYNKVSKQPILAIEVDGFHYHKNGTKQYERDRIKDHILEVYGLPLLRFMTNCSGEREKLSQAIESIL